jgi:hypothetical protein
VDTFTQGRGAQFNYLATVTVDGVAQDLTDTPLTLVLSGPGGRRRELRYLNGGTDGVLEPGGLAVRFRKDNAWTRANLVPGEWEIAMADGENATYQDLVGVAQMLVVDTRTGPLPTAGV